MARKRNPDPHYHVGRIEASRTWAKAHGLPISEAKAIRKDPEFRETVRRIENENRKILRARDTRFRLQKEGKDLSAIHEKLRVLRDPQSTLAELLVKLGRRRADADYPVGDSPK